MPEVTRTSRCMLTYKPKIPKNPPPKKNPEGIENEILDATKRMKKSDNLPSEEIYKNFYISIAILAVYKNKMPEVCPISFSL